MRRAEILAIQQAVQNAVSIANVHAAEETKVIQRGWEDSFLDGPAARDVIVALEDFGVPDAREVVRAILQNPGMSHYNPLCNATALKLWVRANPKPDVIPARNIYQVTEWPAIEMMLGTTKMTWADLQIPTVNLITDLSSVKDFDEINKALVAYRSLVTR